MEHSKKVLDMCKAFVSKDELRPALCGINYREGCVIATDGMILIKINEVVNPKYYGTYDLKSNLIDERYPDCLNMINSSFSKSVLINTSDLLKTIESLKKVHEFGWMKFTFETSNELTIITENVDSFFSIQGVAKVIFTPKNDINNEKFSIGVVANHIISILKVFKKYDFNDHVLIQMNESNRAITISNSNITCLCMPIMLN